MVVDPKVQSTWMPYAYANDNPLSNTDPTGLDDAGQRYVAQVTADCNKHPKDCKGPSLKTLESAGKAIVAEVGIVTGIV